MRAVLFAVLMNIRMMGNRVLVELEEQKIQLGLHLPEGYSDERKGTVIAIGNGRRIKKGPRKGERLPIECVKVGDTVLLPLGLGPGSRPIDLDGKKYFSVIVEDLLGILER